MSDFIEVEAKGARLFLTPEEYKEALKRGKGILRARRQRKRELKAREAVERKLAERMGAVCG